MNEWERILLGMSPSRKETTTHSYSGPVEEGQRNGDGRVHHPAYKALRATEFQYEGRCDD